MKFYMKNKVKHSNFIKIKTLNQNRKKKFKIIIINLYKSQRLSIIKYQAKIFQNI